MGDVYFVLIVLVFVLFGLGSFFGVLQRKCAKKRHDMFCTSTMNLEVLSDPEENSKDEKPVIVSNVDDEEKLEVLDEEIF